MQHRSYTACERSALRLLGEFAGQVARTGRLTLKAATKCRRVHHENTILGKIVQLGRLTSGQITEVTGITKDLPAMLGDLCHDDLLRSKQVNGMVFYCMRPKGRRRVANTSHASSEPSAVSLLGEFAGQVARTGRLTRDALSICLRMDRENTILGRIVELGYLTEEHIAEVTGITEGLSEILAELCAKQQLQRKKISGITIYRIMPKGLYRVPEIMVPGFGVIDLTESPSLASEFCRMGVSKRITMHHLLECSELAVRLYLSTNSTVLCDRTARMVERLYNRGKNKSQRRNIAVASRGHKVDLVAISPLGELTVYEVELSPHGKEGTEICLQLVQSDYIHKVIYLSFTEAQHGEVERRFSSVVEENPEHRAAMRKCVAVQCKDWRPPVLSRIMPEGACRSTARRQACDSPTAASAQRNVRA